MTKRMREYIVHWLLLHGTDWVSHVDDVFFTNYHLPCNHAQADETVLSVMLKGGYLAYQKYKLTQPEKWKLTEKALCKAKH